MELEKYSFEQLLGAIGKKLDNQITFKVTIPTTEIEPPVVIPPSDPFSKLELVEIGYWKDNTKILNLVIFDQGTFVIQVGSKNEYIFPRGKNIITDKNTKLLSFPNLDTITSLDSEYGGLFPPSNFPEEELFKLGFIKNAEGEFVLK